MKTITKITIAIALFVLGTTTSTAQWGKNTVKGSGNITTTTVNTSDYDVISAIGSMDFILIKGTEGKISITADDNLHDLVVIETKGDELVVKLKKNASYKSKEGIKITIPFSEISEASLTGSGDLISRDVINAKNFKSSMTGSGDISLELDVKAVNAKVTGSGDMNLSGKSQSIDGSVIGSGDLNAKKLKAEDAEVYVNGSGDAYVFASKNLKARVSGSGDIEYYGNPANRDTKVSGSGDIDGN